MKVYKIQDKESGLFSNGGATPRWTKAGKTWSQFGHLKAHLRQHINLSGVRYYKNARIVELEVVETAVNGGDVSQLMVPMVEEELKHAEYMSRGGSKYYEDDILKLNGLKAILKGEK